jgi:hypothetical protein
MLSRGQSILSRTLDIELTFKGKNIRKEKGTVKEKSRAEGKVAVVAIRVG